MLKVITAMGASAVLALLAAPAVAATYTLDFSGPTTGPGSICTTNVAPAFPTTDCASSGTFINQSYGDQPGVDVQYFTATIPFGVQSFLYQNTNYPGLTPGFVIYNPLSTISFVAEPGFSVGLAGLTLGYIFATPTTQSGLEERITITDLADNSLLFDSGLFFVGGNPPSVFDFTTALAPRGLTSATGLRLLLEKGLGGLIALDDVVYSAERINGPAPIPVPAALPLLATAFGALALLRRHRRAR